MRTWASQRARPLPCCDWETVLFFYRSSNASTFFGNKSARLVKGDMGGADDLIAALDELVARGIADPARLACTGSVRRVISSSASKVRN